MMLSSNDKARNITAGKLLVASVALAIAYIPHGLSAAFLGTIYAWEELNYSTSFYVKIYDIFLILGAVTGNLQVILSLVSLKFDNALTNNPILKVCAMIGQLLWAPYAYQFYAWYFWVVGSAILFSTLLISGNMANSTRQYVSEDHH